MNEEFIHQGDVAVAHEIAILGGIEAPKTVSQKQFLLASEYAQKQHIGGVVEELSSRNEIMNLWITSELAESFRLLLGDPSFSTHARLQGQWQNVTLADVEAFHERKQIPE